MRLIFFFYRPTKFTFIGHHRMHYPVMQLKVNSLRLIFNRILVHTRFRHQETTVNRNNPAGGYASAINKRELINYRQQRIKMKFIFKKNLNTLQSYMDNWHVVQLSPMLYLIIDIIYTFQTLLPSRTYLFVNKKLLLCDLKPYYLIRSTIFQFFLFNRNCQ